MIVHVHLNVDNNLSRFILIIKNVKKSLKFTKIYKKKLEIMVKLIHSN